jgi:Stc1 domain
MALRHYAGDFDCSDCRRKRLTAAYFSKSMANKKRSDPSAQLRCLDCVVKLAESERQAALRRSEISSSTPDSAGDNLTCSVCSEVLPQLSFSGSQRRKGVDARCMRCIAEGEEAERKKSEEDKAGALRAAQDGSTNLGPNASAMERLVAASTETAEEANFVTGLKPVKLGRRGRGGSWRSRGPGRGTTSKK